MPAESSTSARATTTTTISNKDVFISLPNEKANRVSRRTLVFLIPGNPGLIGYYDEFLSQVRDALQVQEQAGLGAGVRAGVGVAGLSLGGFEVESGDGDGDGDGNGDGLKQQQQQQQQQQDQEKWVRDVQVPRVQTEEKKKSGRVWGNARGLFGLRDQIELCHARVEAIVELMMQRGVVGHGQGQGAATAAAAEEQEVDVILIGHSVGAYIALEVIKLWNERGRAVAAGRRTWTPKAAILLMPTVIDLHKSASGQIATPLLSTVPFVPELLQSVVSVLRYGLPPTWLKGLVSRVTGMKEGQGLETTVNFVASARGVNESLHLARDEVAQIRADKWGEEIWGAGEDKDSAESSRVSPALYFLFAQQDHWVADATRKEIVDMRGGSARRMVIDEEEGLAHAWPLRSTEPVVKIVLPWIQEVLLEATERQQQASKAE